MLGKAKYGLGLALCRTSAVLGLEASARGGSRAALCRLALRDLKGADSNITNCIALLRTMKEQAGESKEANDIEQSLARTQHMAGGIWGKIRRWDDALVAFREATVSLEKLGVEPALHGQAHNAMGIRSSSNSCYAAG